MADADFSPWSWLAPRGNGCAGPRPALCSRHERHPAGGGPGRCVPRRPRRPPRARPRADQAAHPARPAALDIRGPANLSRGRGPDGARRGVSRVVGRRALDGADRHKGAGAVHPGPRGGALPALRDPLAQRPGGPHLRHLGRHLDVLLPGDPPAAPQPHVRPAGPGHADPWRLSARPRLSRRQAAARRGRAHGVEDLRLFLGRPRRRPARRREARPAGRHLAEAAPRRAEDRWIVAAFHVALPAAALASASSANTCCSGRFRSGSCSSRCSASARSSNTA